VLREVVEAGLRRIVSTGEPSVWKEDPFAAIEW
jgi:hypothetical protein